MFSWDNDNEPSPDEKDAAEAFADIIQITKRFSSKPAHCHTFMSASDALMRRYLEYLRSNPVKAREYIAANSTIVDRHVGARQDATHEDICMFAPEHGAGGSGGGNRPHRRHR